DRALALRPAVDDPPLAAKAHPPEARPVLAPLVDEQRDARMHADVPQALEVTRALRLLVDGAEDGVACEYEADRDDVRSAVRVDRTEQGDARVQNAVAHRRAV